MSAKRIKELEDLILYHKQKYYKGKTKIDDTEYDSLEDELRTLSPDSYALQFVGYEVFEDKIEHETLMLSLAKLKDSKEVFEWMENETCIITDKLDGSSASLVYEKGKFILAKTRGDGISGENLTKYFRFITIPKMFSHKILNNINFEIRGEVCISKKNFYLISQEMGKRNLEKPKSIRNIVAGLLHKKSDYDLCKFLDFISYEIITSKNVIHTEVEKLDLLRNEGFIIPKYTIIKTLEDLNRVIDEYSDTISNHKYLTDGLVISVNNVENQINRGFTAHHPKGRLAFKFKSDTAITEVQDIIVNVGRTGRITFVGLVNPVELSGATVRRVTFHNMKYMKEHHLNKGAEIEITRSGEVIPNHEKTIRENGSYQFPDQCPSCGSELFINETEVDLLCKNDLCKAKSYGLIANWVRVCGIENIGDSTLEKLYKENLVSSISDLYKLKQEDIIGLENIGEKSSKIIIDNINSSRKIDIQIFLTGIGIDGLGKGVAKLITKKYPVIEDLKKMTVESLTDIKGVGEILANNIYFGMDDRGWKLLEELSDLNVHIIDNQPFPNDIENQKPFMDMNFVITGKLSRPRKEIEQFIENNGGNAVKAVSKNTSYLVCNEKSASSKYKNAEKLGVQIINETQLFKLIEDSLRSI